MILTLITATKIEADMWIYSIKRNCSVMYVSCIEERWLLKSTKPYKVKGHNGVLRTTAWLIVLMKYKI